MNPAGWVPVEQVLDYLQMSKTDLLQFVVHNSKKRLQITDSHIRACQGHSTEAMPIDINALEQSWEIFSGDASIWHGTNLEAVENIATDGILPVKRTHVHLAPSKDSLVGKRHNTPVLLEVSSSRVRKMGIQIFQAQNGVVLARTVPAECIVHAHPISRAALKKAEELKRLFRRYR